MAQRYVSSFDFLAGEDWSDERIDKLTRPELIATAEQADLDEYTSRTSVATFEINSQLILAKGALTAIEKLVETFKIAYVNDGLHVQNKYGATVYLQIWKGNDLLRGELKLARSEALDRKTEEA